MAMSLKWTFKRQVRLTGDSNLQKLVQFYVWGTPVPDTSCKGRTFKELGWSGAGFNTLHAEMRKTSGFPTNKYWFAVPAKEVDRRLGELGVRERLGHFEFAVHTQKEGLNKTEALFYFIRNSFAHGGFRKSEYEGESYYLFENRSDGKLKGRAVIKEDTLLAWIKILEKPRPK